MTAPSPSSLRWSVPSALGSSVRSSLTSTAGFLGFLVTLEVARSQLVLRVLVLLGPVLAVLSTGPAGNWPPWWWVVGVVALGGWAAVRPDSPAPSSAALAALVWWSLSLGEGVPAWSVVAALALLVAHVAALLAAYGPAAMPVDAPTIRLWVRRGALVGLVVPAAYAAARVLGGEPDQPGIWVLGVAVACAATVAATVMLPLGGDE